MPAAAAAAAPKLNQGTAQRIEVLEREMALVNYDMELVRDGAVAVGGLATVELVIFGFLSRLALGRL